MPKCYVKVLRRPPYHGDEIERGLIAQGYEPARQPFNPGPGDVLVLWNRYIRDEHLASLYEAAGGRVLVVENGYLGREHHDTFWYAMALHQHGGAGEWTPRPDRVAKIPLKVSNWRKGGDEIVILAQRGMGSDKVKEPQGWAERAMRDLAARTDRPIRVRGHPGAQKNCTTKSLLQDIKRAHCCVTWGSGAGIKALCIGIPVFHGFPEWIGRRAARPLDWDLEDPFYGDRMDMLADIAGATWSLQEIESGEAFACLLT